MLNKDPQRRDLIVFGCVLPLFFGLAGLVASHRMGAPGAARTIWMAGAALTFLYAAAPPLRRPLFVGWNYATYPLGWAVSHLILLALFYAVITPIGLLVRLFAQDTLARRPDRKAATYWSRRDNTGGVDRYFQQS